MDFISIATPLCLAIEENHIHACFHHPVQSFVVHA